MTIMMRRRRASSCMSMSIAPRVGRCLYPTCYAAHSRRCCAVDPHGEEPALAGVSNHEASMPQHLGLVLRDASLRSAPQDEGREWTCVIAPVVYGAGYADFSFPLSDSPKGTERRSALRLGCRLAAESPLARTRAFRRSIAAVTARAALSIRLLGVPPVAQRPNHSPSTVSRLPAGTL